MSARNPFDFLSGIVRPSKPVVEPAPKPSLADVLGRSTVAVPPAFDSERWDTCSPVRGKSAAELLFNIEDPASAVRAAILADPVMGSDALSRAQLLQGRDFDLTDDAVGRFLHVPFMGAARRTYVNALNEIMLARSQALHAAMAADPAGSLSRWDAVVVGAGPHGLTVAQKLQQAGRSVVIVEAGDGFSSNFREAGTCFRLNSANRADDQSIADLGSGKGNINPLPGPVQVPDISADNWPMASSISEAGTVNLYHSEVPVLFATTFNKVTPQPKRSQTFRASSTPRYAISIFDREAGAGREIYAENLVVATGLGTVRAPIRRLQDTLRNDNDASLSPAEVRRRRLDSDPGIRSVGEAFRLASQQKDPLKPYREPWALIGFGDSAKTFLQYVYGLTGSYPATVAAAQQGTVVGAQWYVGQTGPRSCEKYLSQTRGRYADLVAVLRRGKVNLVASKAAQIQKSRGGYTIVDDDGERREVTRVVYATGFDDESRRLGNDLATRPEEAPGAKDIDDYTDKVRVRTEPEAPRRKKGVQPPPDGPTVGRRFLKAGAGVYLVGPAAGKGLVAKSKTAGVGENVASLANLIPLTRQLADTLAEEIPAKHMPELPQSEALSIATESNKSTMQIPLSSGVKDDVLSLDTQLTMKALLAQGLSTVKIDGRPLSLRFSEKRGQLRLEANTSMDNVQALNARFADMPGFYDNLGRLLSAQRTPLTVELGGSGRIKFRAES